MNDDHQRLRAVLRDATDDVHPRGDFTDIRTRAQEQTPVASRSWAGPTLAAAAAVVLAIGGVTWFAQHQQSAAPAAVDSHDHDDPSAPATGTTVDPGHTSTVTTYFVGRTAAGPRLFGERHTLDGIRTSDLDAAVSDVVEHGPKDPDYTRWLPADGLIASAEEKDGTVTIDLSEQVRRPSGMDDATAEMMVQSLVWTAGDAVGSEVPVLFTVDGRSVSSLLDVPVSTPLGKGSPDSTLATVSISSPSQGETVDSGFTVEGRAATFEANVVWELKQGDRVVRNGYTTAAECCTLSPYTFEVTAPPGRYTLVVHDTDESDGEGVGTSEDTKEITVR